MQETIVPDRFRQGLNVSDVFSHVQRAHDKLSNNDVLRSQLNSPLPLSLELPLYKRDTDLCERCQIRENGVASQRTNSKAPSNHSASRDQRTWCRSSRAV